ncbi:SWI/SNF and RSC complexes subunit ssr3-like protein [Elsinoe fawcettii]|nr:SWI/SNF and RSC complexes subunit ssr3-like protein [Elsinoe fawcettii]
MQQQRGYAQQRSGRNPGYGHPMAQPPNEAAIRQRIQQEEAAKRKERETQQRILHRPSDRNIPDDVAQCVIGDGVDRYKKLRAMERRLDATMMQKRLDLTDPYRQRTELEGTLRVWISNTADGQPWQIMEEHTDNETFDLADNSQATYRVKIEGRLIDGALDEESKDDAMEEDGAEAKSKETGLRPRFSDFFRAIKIDFDRPASLQADGVSTIEWKRPSHPNDPNKPRLPSSSESSFDTLEFTRKGDEEINITISLFRDHQPPRYRLSPPLASLLALPEADTASVLGAIWDYVRHHQLQEDDEHRRFICDDSLRQIFGLEVLTFPQLREIILTQGHLTELPPIQLPYTIRLDKDYLSPSTGDASAKTIYDVLVPLPSPLDGAIKKLATDTNHIVKLREIQDIDADIAVLVQAISRATQKHKFLSSLSEDPVRFVRRWVGSQKRDLEIFLAEGGRGYGEDAPLPESMRKGGEGSVWGTEGVREATGVYLARASAR